MPKSANSGCSATRNKAASWMSSMKSQDKTEIIRKVAQDLYEKKGRQPGHDLENWLEAERLVKSGKV